jgi:hypothetical protein
MVWPSITTQTSRKQWKEIEPSPDQQQQIDCVIDARNGEGISLSFDLRALGLLCEVSENPFFVYDCGPIRIRKWVRSQGNWVRQGIRDSFRVVAPIISRIDSPG